MSDPAVGGLFISYRRQESSGMTGRLYDRLVGRFGDDQVFMDVDTIALGVDFTQVIAEAVSNCTVLLAVIGPAWLTITDEDGQPRLEDPDDIVRLEIQTALERDIRVIPILVEGAVMPRRRQLPEQLAGLARRNAHFLRHESFRSDADRLLEAIESILPSPSASQIASGAAQVEPVATDPAEVASGGQTVPGGRPQADVPSGRQGTKRGHADPAPEHAKAPEKAKRQARPQLADRGPAQGTRPVSDTITPQMPAAGGVPRLAHVLTGHDGEVWNVAFSPDGRLLASCGLDHAVRLWDPATGEHLRTLTGHTGQCQGGGVQPGRAAASQLRAWIGRCGCGTRPPASTCAP